MDKNEVKEYYNNYANNDLKYGCNERHLFLYNKLKENGLNNNSTVLELGCGVGTITKLITQTVKLGKIVVSDISSKSIEYSKMINKNRNIEFIVSDISNFKYDAVFDFVTLFDVLEHVPEQEHENIFANIVNMMDENSKLLIHLPTFENTKYAEKHKPDKLQIIDQAILVEDVIKKTIKAGLRLEFMQLSNIWQYYDYQFFIFGIKREFSNISIPQKKDTIINKISKKLKRL